MPLTPSRPLHHPLSPQGDTLAVLDACVLLPPRLKGTRFWLLRPTNLTWQSEMSPNSELKSSTLARLSICSTPLPKIGSLKLWTKQFRI